AAVTLLVAGALGVRGHAQAPVSLAPGQYSQLPYRYIGPLGNRVTSVTGVPGNPDVYYFGAAGGGVFRTTDGGSHWTPIFDHEDVGSIGAIAVAPSDPNVIWVGTGESWIRSNVSIGDGVYKSTDAGRTWQHMGLDQTGRIGRVVIDPHNPDVVLVAAEGMAYGPQTERGVFRTDDGGRTWKKVLFVNEDTGAADIAMDPQNPRILLASTWQLVIHTWGRTSGGPGSGLWKSTDEGLTWTRLRGHGLPSGTLGKIGMAFAPSEPSRVYALIEGQDNAGGVFRSDDDGDTWTAVNHSHTPHQRPHYYTRMAVEPDNPNEVYFISVELTVSLDGGRTFADAPGGDHGDNHDMWIDPTDGNRMIVGNDGGAIISVDRGRTWARPTLPIAQIYHVYTDDRVPYNVYGNRQDGPSTRGPSDSRLADGTIPIGMWHSVGGCESGFAVPDPKDPDIIWSNCYGNALDRFNEKTRQARAVSPWPDNPMGHAARDLKYRFQWTFPIAIDPLDHNRVYVGSQYVHETTDGGQTWKVISPDLTLNDKAKQGPSGGLSPDNASVEYYPVVFAITASPVKEGVIWAGTNDGQVQVTEDGGAHWTNVTKNIPGLPPDGTVSNIEADRWKAGTAYLSVDLHQANNRDPFIYQTTDFGRSWTSLSAGIPKSVFSYVHCVREDPKRPGMLYVGTENAVYFSLDDGAHWMPLQNNLPHAPADWLTVQEPFDDLVVATYGRGFWILDDIAALRELTPAVVDSEAHLFTSRPAWRFRFISDPMAQEEDPAAGHNPPYGADITYDLKAAPKGDVTISIADAAGHLVRTMKGTAHEGINRVWWNLRYDKLPEVKLRTPPTGDPYVTVGEKGWRPLVAWGDPPQPLVVPGTYTVTLSADGHTSTQKIVVNKDPNTDGTDADIVTQTRLVMSIRDDVAREIRTINQLEWVRKEIADLKNVLDAGAGSPALVKAADQLNARALDVENKLFNTELTGASEDALRYPVRLYSKLNDLAGDVSQSDYPPTQAQQQVYTLLRQDLESVETEAQTVLTQDVAAFNSQLNSAHLGAIVVPKS
ncbi:MAG TPA: hypothetical protein VND92_02200, partial [Vicinamibacterales bacterium]|nr:hypothetical protein [Vicinamibacterales bacterium]